MNETIFDLIQEDIPSGKNGYIELAKNAPQPKEKSFLNDVSDYAKTILKGSIEGVTRLGRMMGPLDVGKPTSKILEEQTEYLDKILPTDEGYIQRGLRRGLSELPSMTAIGFGSAIQAVPRTILAGFIGEGAKDLGAPEWAQSALELTAYIGPDVTKKLLEKGSQKELITKAKEFGMSDEAITPLIQSDFKQKWLSKLSPKRGATQKSLKTSKESIGEIYETIQKSEHAAQEITEKANGKLINSLYQILNDIPRGVRGKIEKDLKDLISNKITGKSLINFYKDINSTLSSSTKELYRLKNPIKEALSTLSPELSKDFEFANELYSKYSTIASKLKPTITSDIVSAAEALGLTGSVLFGNYPTLIGILGEKLGKKLAQQMLINPHFQQLSKKMVVAINQNKFGLAKKVVEDLKREVEKISPQLSNQIKDLSEVDFVNLLTSHQQEKVEQR